VLLGLAACVAGGPDPAVAPPSPVSAAARVPPPPPVPQGRPGQVFTAPAPGQVQRDEAALAAACRRDADRIIATRDRGQLMREDERDARVGTDSSIFARRAETDRLGRLFERDRIADECVRQNTRTGPQR
jgi:hypothetical protein